MPKHFKNISEFISALEAEGELKRIKDEVSQDLEITEFYLREIEKGEDGKALLFENVIGSEMPVLINSMGSFKRMKMLLGGREFDEISAEIKSYLDLSIPTGFSEKIKKLISLAKLRKILPKKVRKAACQEIVLTGNDIDINRIPILKTWPEDGGRFITLPLVFTKNLDQSAKNCGMYRMQVYDQKTTGMHWQIHHDGSNFYSQYRKANKRMEVAVAIGGDPILNFAAIAPLPPKIFEMIFAGFIRGKAVDMVKCKTVNIEVPAEAEIILEGYVEPDELREEGPFGDHTGYYTLEEDYPVFHITAITMRKNPVYLTTVVGRSPQEDCYFGGKATERIFLPMFQAIAPEVKDMILPWDSCFHNCMILNMEKHFPLHGKRLMNQIWGTGQASTTKSIVILDPEVELSDDESMLNFVLNTLDITTDMVQIEGIVDALDHASYDWAYGGKLGLDLTSRILNELKRNEPKKKKEYKNNADYLKILSEIDSAVLDCRIYANELKNTVLLVKVNKKESAKFAKKNAPSIFNSDLLENFDIFVVLDEKNDLHDGHKVMWRIFNNTDWMKDLYFNEGKSRILVDSSYKTKEDGYLRIWPGDLEIPSEIKKIVDQKIGK
jgi:4-hydroxy-3-polyprenylbenzoate decarboxylase